MDDCKKGTAKFCFSPKNRERNIKKAVQENQFFIPTLHAKSHFKKNRGFLTSFVSCRPSFSFQE